MFQIRVIIWIVMVIVLPCSVWAAPREFIENYTYSAGEADSKLTCRTVSLIEVKRLLLEKIGTYLESRTEVKNFQIEKDEIVALTAGIVKLEILDEKWNGETYSLTAKIEANPDDITQAINNLRKQQGKKMENIQRLKEINDESLEQMREMQSRMQQLQSDLLKLNQDVNAHEGILNAWGLYEKAVRLRQGGKTHEAITALNAVIRNNPTHLAYLERGMAYMELNMFNEAIADLSETLKVEPDTRGALWTRGKAYLEKGDRKKGRRDIERAAKLGHGRAKKWLEAHPERIGTGRKKSYLP